MTTTKKVPKVTAVLGLAKLTNPQKLVKATAIRDKMTGNSNFPNPTPTLATVTAQLDKAKASLQAAQSKAHGASSPMHADIKALLVLLDQLASYVTAVANADGENAIAITESSGMSVKKQPLRLPKTFTAVAGKTPGSVSLSTKAIKGSVYIYEMSTDPTNATLWTVISTDNKVKYTKTGLTSGTRYYFRVALITKSVQAPWSAVLNVIIP
jgi:hypothetical protein